MPVAKQTQKTTSKAKSSAPTATKPEHADPFVNKEMVPFLEPAIPILTLADIEHVADLAVKSGLFRDVKNAAQGVMKMLIGREIGFGVGASLKGISFSDRGAVTLSANLQAAAMRRAGYTWIVKRLDEEACELEIYYRGEFAGTSALTMKQAIAAKMNLQWDDKAGGYKEKQPWAAFPRNMLFARCISNANKWFAPETTNGIPVYDPDELTPREPGFMGDSFASRGEYVPTDDDMIDTEPQPKQTPAETPPTQAPTGTPAPTGAPAPEQQKTEPAAPVTMEEAQTAWRKAANDVAKLKPVTAMGKKEQKDTLAQNAIKGDTDPSAIMAKAQALQDALESIKVLSQ